VRSDSPSVSVADLGYAKMQGGAYVFGNVTLRKAASLPREVLVQVLDQTGKVLADSSTVPVARQNIPRATSFAYRLGGIPRDAGPLKVVVIMKKKKLASAAVTLAQGNADTQVQDLRIELPGSAGK
jgi:hypothetical protein